MSQLKSVSNTRTGATDTSYPGLVSWAKWGSTNKDRAQPLVAKENSRSQSGSARAQLTVKTEWNFKDKIQLMQVHRGKKKISQARAHSALHGGFRDLRVAGPAVAIVILIPHM